MHLPDHYVDLTTCLATGAISTGAVALGLYRLRREPRQVVMLLPSANAGIFAAQMLNFPVAAGTSGHLLGGALAGILLGPWAGMVAMAVVVSVQAIVFGDGGIAALGANILNMAVLAAPLGAAIDRFLRGGISPPVAVNLASLLDRSPQCLISAAVAGAATVLAAALACSLEMGASGTFEAADAIPAMLAVHAWIALSEAAVTAAVVAVLLALRAHVRSHQPVQLQAKCIAARRVVLALTLATLVSISLSPFASTFPDGLESVFETLAPVSGDEAAPLVPSLLGDYALPGVTHANLSTALAGLLGVLVVATSAAPLLLLPKRPQSLTA